jgi:hypothetical protein
LQSRASHHFKAVEKSSGLQIKDKDEYSQVSLMKSARITIVKNNSLNCVSISLCPKDYLLPHPIWSKDEVEEITVTHRPPENITDKLAYYTVMTLRKSFDLVNLIAYIISLPWAWTKKKTDSV